METIQMKQKEKYFFFFLMSNVPLSSWTGIINEIKISILFQLIYRFKAIPIKIPDIFVELLKLF